eukprot:Platyproteum_vivax@DN2351_c0_g1_i1.p1
MTDPPTRTEDMYPKEEEAASSPQQPTPPNAASAASAQPLMLEGCPPTDLKAMAKDMASSVVAYDVDLHKRLENLLKMYEEAARLLEEAAIANPEPEMRAETQMFLSVKPTFLRRMEHLRRVNQVLDDIPIPETIPCNSTEKATSMKARAMCNMRQADSRFQFSQKYTQATSRVGTAFHDASTTVQDWWRRTNNQQSPQSDQPHA